MLTTGATACDDDEPTTASVTTETQTVVPTVTQTVVVETRSSLSVSLSEFALNPANPTVKPGTVTITARNDGDEVHSLQVDGPNGSKTLANPLDPDETGNLTIRLVKPGKYNWFCPIDDHRAMGMKGKITVR